jgi:hypothetical protein
LTVPELKIRLKELGLKVSGRKSELVERLREAKLGVGSRVEAVFADDGLWYPGTVSEVNNDGSFQVHWADPGEGPPVSRCAVQSVKVLRPFFGHKVGDPVDAIYEKDAAWYNGTIVAVHDNRTFQVSWDDPDGGPALSTLLAEKIKQVDVYKNYTAGDRVQAMCKDDGRWHSGTVQASSSDANGQPLFEVLWDYADTGEEVSDCRPRYMKPIIVFTDYQVGDRVDALPHDEAQTKEWQPAVIALRLTNDTFFVRWQSEDGPESSVRRAEDIKGVYRDYKVGDRVEALSTDCNWYPATVDLVHGGGAFEVRWDDSGDGPPTTMCSAEEMSVMATQQDYYDEWAEDMYSDSGDASEFGEWDEGESGEQSDHQLYQGPESEGSLLQEESPQILVIPDDLLTRWPGQFASAGADKELAPQWPRGGASPSAWTVSTSTTLRLTFSPRLRGPRRFWRMRPFWRTVGWTCKQLGPFLLKAKPS